MALPFFFGAVLAGAVSVAVGGVLGFWAKAGPAARAARTSEVVQDPLNRDMPNLSFPGAESLAVGEVSLLWLAPDRPVPSDDVLTAEDRGHAVGIKAPTRKAEFLRSRTLIRVLTGWQGTLAKAATGEPQWPHGWTGSLTHKDGWIGLALERLDGGSIGIDAEDVGRLKPGFEPKILNAAESSRLDAWSHGDAEQRLAQLAAFFSFKEALFKAVFPVGRKMFYFPDAEIVRFDPATGGITARLLVDASSATPAGADVSGRVVAWKGAGRHFVLTSAKLHRVLDGGVGRRDGALG